MSRGRCILYAAAGPAVVNKDIIAALVTGDGPTHACRTCVDPINGGLWAVSVADSLPAGGDGDGSVVVRRFGAKPLDLGTDRFDGTALLASPAVAITSADDSLSATLSTVVLASVGSFDALHCCNEVSLTAFSRFAQSQKDLLSRCSPLSHGPCLTGSVLVDV